MSTIQDTISNRDAVVIIDRSGSMTATDCPGGKSRWKYCQESVQALVSKLEETDPDGVELYFFNSQYQFHEGVTSAKVPGIFAGTSPQGSTYGAPVLAAALNRHFALAKRSTTIVVITDGEAADRDDMKKCIIAAAAKIEADSELAISFIQIGKDISARHFLKELDDDLQSAGAKFDIVDCKTMDDLENMPLEEILFDAIMD